MSRVGSFLAQSLKVFGVQQGRGGQKSRYFELHAFEYVYIYICYDILWNR